MVLLAKILAFAEKKTPSIRKHFRTGFLDILEVRVKSGTGGFGLPRYGGVGGQGGSVYFQAKDNLNLWSLRSKLRFIKVQGGIGCDSNKKGIIGRPGEDVIIEVPTGVSVYTKNGILKGELDQSDSKLLVVSGGLGGCKDNGYCGQKGDQVSLVLDLKLVADVALVGFPNAGKSTLLKSVSRAKPKIANYPFTTIKPNLGMLEYSDKRIIKMADLPGLIEGAHVNIGMGHKFLKHIERCKIMLYIVDIQGFQLSLQHQHRNCLDTVVLLNKEIELYKPDLLEKPAILLVNKMDTENADEILKEIKPKLENLEAYVPDCPELIRPERVVKFESVISTSLINSDKNEVSIIKDTIRKVIDDLEIKQLEESKELELELIQKIKSRNQQLAPNLA